MALVRVLDQGLLALGQDRVVGGVPRDPETRGQGYGRSLITEAMRVTRERGAEYAFLVTSEDDRLAQHLYEAAGFCWTEDDGGPLMLAYERDM